MNRHEANTTSSEVFIKAEQLEFDYFELIIPVPVTELNGRITPPVPLGRDYIEVEYEDILIRVPLELYLTDT